MIYVPTANFYSPIGRPSIDPELMVRMLVVGYCYGIRSERRLCEEVHLNRLSLVLPVGSGRRSPQSLDLRRIAMGVFVTAIYSAGYSMRCCGAAWQPA